MLDLIIFNCSLYFNMILQLIFLQSILKLGNETLRLVF